MSHSRFGLVSKFLKIIKTSVEKVSQHPTHRAPKPKIYHGGVKKHQKSPGSNNKNSNQDQPEKPPKNQRKPIDPGEQNLETTSYTVNQIIRLARLIFQPNKILVEIWRQRSSFQLYSETHSPTTFKLQSRRQIEPNLQTHRKILQQNLPKKSDKNSTFKKIQETSDETG